MARFTSFALIAAAALSQNAVYAQESTEIAISAGDLQTTVVLPAFPAPTSVETITETSTVISGIETTTVIVGYPTAGSNSSVATTTSTSTLAVIPPPSNSTAAPSNATTAINTSAQSSYISSLLGELTKTSTATANTTATTTATATATATATVTSTTVVGTVSTTYVPVGTGGGVKPTNSSTAPPSEYTGAASGIQRSGMSIMGMVLFGAACLMML